MSEINPNFARSGKIFKTQIIKDNKNPMKKRISAENLSNPKPNDIPDTINDNNTNVFKAQKLLNFRRGNKHMTQIPHHIDQPDVLLGLNEYKETRLRKGFHSIKELTSFKSIPDLPDTIEPINEDNFNVMPRPESMNKIKKLKNEEAKNIENIHNKDVNNKKIEKIQLTDIKERNETEEMKTEENRKNELENEDIEEKQKIISEKNKNMDENGQKREISEKLESDEKKDKFDNDEEKKKEMVKLEE